MSRQPDKRAVAQKLALLTGHVVLTSHLIRGLGGLEAEMMTSDRDIDSFLTCNGIAGGACIYRKRLWEGTWLMTEKLIAR